jgi:hypothetical protein
MRSHRLLLQHAGIFYGLQHCLVRQGLEGMSHKAYASFGSINSSLQMTGGRIIAWSIERTSNITYVKASRRTTTIRYSTKPNIGSTEITSYDLKIIRVPISEFLRMEDAKELCMGSMEFFEIAKESITQTEGKRERKARLLVWLRRIFGGVSLGTNHDENRG